MSIKEELDGRIARLSAQGREIAALKMSPETWSALISDLGVERGPNIEGPPFGLFYEGIPVRPVEGFTGIEFEPGRDG